MFTGYDIYVATLPYVNQQGITPLLTDKVFIATINNAINRTITYKGRLWNFLLTTEEFDINEQQKYTLKYPVLGVHSVWYMIGGEWHKTRYDERNYNKGEEGFFISHLDNVLEVIRDDIEKIRIVYYKSIQNISKLDDVIDMPYVFKTPLVYFTLADLITIRKNFEQNRDMYYIKEAEAILDNIAKIETNVPNLINVLAP